MFDPFKVIHGPLWYKILVIITNPPLLIDFLQFYESEIISIILLVIVLALVVKYIRPYIFKDVYMTKHDEWRINRKIGWLIRFPDKKKWKQTSSETVRIYIKPKKHKAGWLELKSDDIITFTSNKMIIGKTCLYWKPDKMTYIVLDVTPMNYDYNYTNLEKVQLAVIDNTDQASTRGARMSPVLIHNNLLTGSIPIDPTEYAENEYEAIMPRIKNLKEQLTEQGHHYKSDETSNIDELVSEEEENENKEDADDLR
jgi:hypothetical protein